MKKYYITTPIYYPSDNLHIGHTYTTVAADTIKRYKQLQGYDVMFVTGTDEHGLKIQEKAKEVGMEPKEYVDGIVMDIKKLWKALDISYDIFIRTTDEYHMKVVKDIFNKLYEQGDIYKSLYEGWYCTPCESFWTESQLVNGKCPDCGREVHKTKEEAYFFKLSKYREDLLKLFEEHPEFLQPESRKNEMVNNFLNAGLDDLCVSRTTFDWGIKVPFDDEHVVYVWLDALLCYITALGYGSDNDNNFKKFWPADVHLVGKEIVRFHTIIWPAVLMALGIEIPKKVFGHGWILFEEDKMSKSKGNIVYPEPLIELYGVDAFKYFLLKEFSFGQDGSFSKEKFLARLNSDLANDLGNLVSRTVAMVNQYFDGIVPEPKLSGEHDDELIKLASQVPFAFEEYMEKLNFSQALEEIWKLIRRTNKYVDETTPWILGREGDTDRLCTVLYNLCESLRIISILIEPFMKNTSKEIKRQLGLESSHTSWDSAKKWGVTTPNVKVSKGDPLFPRLDVKVELEKLEKANKKLITERSKKNKLNVKEVEEEQFITIDEFDKVKLKVAEVLSVEEHPNADKLLVLKLKLGEETRQVVSGIKKYYNGDELVGKKVIVVTNLKPIKLRGVESHGMILAAECDGKLTLVSTLEDIPSGAEIS